MMSVLLIMPTIFSPSKTGALLMFAIFIRRATFSMFSPGEIIRRGKKGFGIPIGKWFSDELKDLMLEMLSKERITRQEIFNPSVVQQLVSDHLARRVDNRKKLWNLLIFQLWWESFGARS